MPILADLLVYSSRFTESQLFVLADLLNRSQNSLSFIYSSRFTIFLVRFFQLNAVRFREYLLRESTKLIIVELHVFLRDIYCRGSVTLRKAPVLVTLYLELL